MPQPRQRKKFPFLKSRGRSPYVISLRHTEVPVSPHEPSEHAPKHEQSSPSRFFQPVTHTPPRVDFVHESGVLRDKHEPVSTGEILHSASRFKNALADTAIGDILKITRLPWIFHLLQAYIPSPRIPLLIVSQGRRLVVFVLVAFVLIAPIGVLDALGRMTEVQRLFLHGKETLAIDIRALSGALQSGQWDTASAIAARVEKKLAALEQSVDGIPVIARRVLGVIPGIRSGENLIHTAREASRAMVDTITAIATSSPQEPLLFFHHHASTLRRLSDYAHAIANDARVVAKSSFVPLSFAQAMQGSRDMIEPTLDLLNHIAHVSELLDVASGFDQPRRYLILFQNPHEMRATGGFLGSYGVLDVRNGIIESFRIPAEGSYGIKGNLSVQVASPGPLRLINERWQFQDANWWPDWKTSAMKILWFWDKSGQPTVDGVIAVNGTVLEDVMRVLGPLPLPRGGPPLAADTVLTTIERAIEQERVNENRQQPKRILGEIADVLRTRLAHLSRAEQMELTSAFSMALERREILLMSTTTQLEQHIDALNWAGGQKRDARDYLRVIHTNLGGGKSDGVMENALNHALFIQADGTAIATVTIDRTHHGTKGDSLTGHENDDYVRLYTPFGSRLIDAWGFSQPPKERSERLAKSDVVLELDRDFMQIETQRERDQRTGTDIYEEGAHTVFGNWLNTRAAERSSAGIRYVLPFRIAPEAQESGFIESLVRAVREDAIFIPYDLAVVRQPGVTGTFTSTITAPPAWEVAWRYPMTATTSPSTIQFSENFTDDLWFGAVWKK
ncbi:DUF4012 domain-containing protein [Candidatus Uhrbacteria bacterium]|nr:DUF4012 domain-containing protein [Candidatus Uhrbacteria bacterium]